MTTTNDPAPSTFSRVLLAVDGSEHSLAGAQLLASLAGRQEFEACAIAVLIPRNASLSSALEAALDAVKQLLGAQGIAVKSELLTGNPAEQIVQFASGYEPDLILMGAKGLRSTLGILMGGVAQQVVEYSHWPVLVMRAPFKGLKQVLLVNDGSEYAWRAVEFLSRFPLPPGIQVKALHVLPPQPDPELMVKVWPLDLTVTSSLPLEDIEESLKRQAELEEQEGQRLIADTTKALEGCGWNVAPLLLRGDAASEIIDYARQKEIDLIVTGSRGLGQVRGWLLGSVSRKLLHYAGCSVLMVRGPEED
jgi:nucleotide-binding universal stress UspA family protein